MNDPFHEPTRRPRLSRQVLTPLLIAAGVIGIPVAFSLSRFSTPRTVRVDQLPAVEDDGTEYPNNTFIAGRGYYHQPFHAWFLLPYNSYEGGRGWYRGGSWRGLAEADAAERRELLQLQAQSRPTGSASRGSGFGSSAGFSRSNSSRPGGGSSSHSAPVLRGGFGHSASHGTS